MSVKIKVIILLSYFIIIIKSQEICNDKGTCAECIQLASCSWCIQPLDNKTQSHCFKNGLTYAHCSDDQLVSPISELKILQDHPIQSEVGSRNPIQLKPQKIRIKLRRGETYVLPFQFAQASNVPIDLYYIMDLSASMEPHRKSLAELGQKLEETMKSITSDFRLGFGSFVDKTDMPFISTVPAKLAKPCTLNNVTACVPAYSFKNHLSLTNEGRFSEQVKNARVSGNLDTPEGGFDALMQAMVCDNEIGWRNDSRRLIIFSTDATFHIAGDGKLAGVVEPNDAKCHMENNKYTADLIYDYPSISQINYIAKSKAMNIFFAIVERLRSTYEIYEKLKNAIENSHVEKLKTESGGKDNIVRLIKEFYERISSKVTMGPTLVDKHISINYTADCKSPELYGCKDVHVKEVINFKASITVDDCTGGDNIYNFKINPSGYSESLDVELEVICGCDCEKQGNPGIIPNAAECGGQGDLKCGVCDCFDDRVGKKCECVKGENNISNNENIELCRNGNDTELCSGYGICSCGQCECLTDENQNQHYSGTYCQCDDYSCPREDGKVCSGNGNCVCGQCKCKTEWSGDACQCQNTNGPCVQDGVICSKNGECKCGKCICNEKYTGEFCEESPHSAGILCEKLKPCVECEVFNYGEYKDSCAINCSIYNITTVEQIDIDSEIYKVCRLDSKDGCRILFKYYSEDKQVFIQAAKELQCPKDINILALVLGLIGSILLAGIIMLLIWKFVTVVKDRREYVKFENDRQQQLWNRNENPLFKTPVTKFVNPTFRLNRMSVRSK